MVYQKPDDRNKHCPLCDSMFSENKFEVDSNRNILIICPLCEGVIEKANGR